MAKISVNKIQNLLNIYKLNIQNSCNWINFCKKCVVNKKSNIQIKDAIKRFCDKEKVFIKHNDHTRRIYKTAMKDLKNKINSNISKIIKMNTFDDIYQFIENLNVYRIGSLTIYDITLLLSAFIGLDLDKEPKYVYSHAGTSVGINELCGLPKSNTKKYTIKELDIGLNNVFSNSKLSPAHLEHFFCIQNSFRKKSGSTICGKVIKNGCYCLWGNVSKP